MDFTGSEQEKFEGCCGYDYELLREGVSFFFFCLSEKLKNDIASCGKYLQQT